MKRYDEIAKNLFLEGYNCAQSVFLAFSDLTGLDDETALKLSAPFGGGMGKMREVCGAVSGMLMALGALEGYTAKDDLAAKQAHYETVQHLMRTFQEENGSYVCKDLLNRPVISGDATPEARTGAYYKKRPCADCVASAAKILMEYLD